MPTHPALLARACALLLAGAIAPLLAQDADPVDEGVLPEPPNTERWTGDWGGARSELEARGLTTELFFTTDVLSNVSGGIERSTATLGNVDLLLTADMEQLLGWGGGTLFLYGLGNFGDSLSAAVGDLQVASNIEAPETAKLYEAWYEQTSLDERLSVLVGLYDVNSEFDVIPAAGLFVNSAQGMGSEFGNSGRNGPSTFPVTSLGLRLQLRATESLYLRAVVADGVPGDLDRPQGTQIRLDEDDGLLFAGEVGFYNLPSEELRGRTRRQREELPPPEQRFGYFGKYALGVWGYTTEFDDFFRVDAGGAPLRNRGTYGVYALAEQNLYYERADPFQGLSAFARVGLADERANLFDRYVGAGLVYRGLLPGAERDRLGLAVAAARLGDDFRTALGGDAERWELAFELTYRTWLTPWMSLQPDLQFVKNPGGDPALDDALIVGARVVVSF